MEQECGIEMKEILRPSSQQKTDAGKSPFLKMSTYSLLISIFLLADASIHAASVELSSSSFTPSIHPHLIERRRENESFLETRKSEYLDDDLSSFPAKEAEESYEGDKNEEYKDEFEDEEGNTPSFFQRSRSFSWARRGSRRSQASGRSRPLSSAIMEEEEEATPPPSSSSLSTSCLQTPFIKEGFE